jgi:uncharacterized protein YyaL (SSP411 family)
MDTVTYGDADVAALVNAQFIPVRVDADRRPDIAERYSLGGWPTTAFLTPDGDVLGGGTFIESHRFADVLRRVSAAFSRGPQLHAVPARRDAAPASSEGAPIERLIEEVTAAFDTEHGGFGTAPKFPHAAPVKLALAIYRKEGSEAHRDIAITTLDAMGWGSLYDEHDGGFYRYAGGADWGQPNDEKLLDVNASMLDLYVEAFEQLELARYLERAEDVLRYVQTWLADPVDGGWAGSQRADPGYYSTDRGLPAVGHAPPPIDRTLYTDWNASMVSAALKAGRVMKDASLSEFAIRSLERVALLCYQPGGGVAHYYDGAPQVRGLLDDQISMAAAQLDAFEATGNVVYEMLAEELALYAVSSMWDEAAGGFFDRALAEGSDVGLLGERRKPFVTNCAAARLLKRLTHTAKQPRFTALADRTLAAMHRRAAAEGPLAAEYVLAFWESGQ